jgi:hypothetical protein
MLKHFRNLDRVLRGDATRLDDLRGGRLDISATGLALAGLLLAALYGVCMGSYGVATGREGSWMQIVASMVKVPALFTLTLLVTFPSLYVFNALVGSRLSLESMLRLLVAGIAVMLALLASFGTIIAFFGFTSTSYTFMKLLNVLVFAVSGLIGLSFLLQTLHRLSISMEPEPRRYWPDAPPPPPANAPTPVDVLPAAEVTPAPPPPGALDRLNGQQVGQNVKTVFRIWVIVFGLVGAQMSWVLRPFIGDPDLPFSWFRARQGNFFEDVWTSVLRLIQG